jgi:hypothetical protein
MTNSQNTSSPHQSDISSNSEHSAIPESSTPPIKTKREVVVFTPEDMAKSQFSIDENNIRNF